MIFIINKYFSKRECAVIYLKSDFSYEPELIRFQLMVPLQVQSGQRVVKMPKIDPLDALGDEMTSILKIL